MLHPDAAMGSHPLWNTPHPGLETKSTRQTGVSVESTLASEDGDSANLMQGTVGGTLEKDIRDVSSDPSI